MVERERERGREKNKSRNSWYNMFSVNKSNEKSFQISFDPQQHVISEDLILSHDPMARSSTAGQSWRRKVAQISGNPDENLSEKQKILKMMHREMEKQRRQEIRTLYFSLISLLPTEFIKGKRSMSDHINGAVSYIKQVSKKIKEEEGRRDQLISLSNPCKIVSETEISKESSNNLTINLTYNGVQILISSCSDRFPLSRVFEELLQQGLDVVHCVSTQVNGSFIHSIQIELSESVPVDLPLLQQRIGDSVSSLKHIFN